MAARNVYDRQTPHTEEYLFTNIPSLIIRATVTGDVTHTMQDVVVA
jgi:hypothetical protein